MQEELRATVFRTFRLAMRSQHRLRQVLLTSLSKLALCPNELEGSFVTHVHDLCNREYQAVMELASGSPVDLERVRPPRMPDGMKDSLKFLLQGNCEASRRLLRLLTCFDH